MSESLGEVEPILEEMGREKSLSVQESLSEISESDVAKFPALFGVRQIIKSDPQEARQQLVEVRIGSEDLLLTVYIFRQLAISSYHGCLEARQEIIYAVFSDKNTLILSGGSIWLSSEVLSVRGFVCPRVFCGGRGHHDRRQRPIQHPRADLHYREL